MIKSKIRKYHAPVWDEPLVMDLSAKGRRGSLAPKTEPEIIKSVGDASALLNSALKRVNPPLLPEISEFEVQRHYLHLSQQTLGMMGISLFGTCTMKYNPRVNERIVGQHLLPKCILIKAQIPCKESLRLFIVLTRCFESYLD